MIAVSDRDAHENDQSEKGRNAERSVRELQRYERANRFGHHHAEDDRGGKLEVAVEREENQKNQEHGERADHQKLRFGF